MTHRTPTFAALAALLVLPFSACENLPGTRTEQSTAVGAAAGAAAGALIAGEGNRLAGALIGSALGAGSGYLIGARTDWFKRDDGGRHARQAIDDARRDPATVDDVRGSRTADLNSDGFVTMDEMVAMEKAGLDDEQILARLRATDQIFDLNQEQERALIASGISPYVVREMKRINQAEKNRVLSEEEPLGRPR